MFPWGVPAPFPPSLSFFFSLSTFFFLKASSFFFPESIQGGLVRYLLAKGLLADLSVLVYQLHPFCAAAAVAASASSPWPAATSPSADGDARRDGPSNRNRSTLSSPPPPPWSSPPPGSPSGAARPLSAPPGSSDTASPTASRSLSSHFSQPPPQPRRRPPPLLPVLVLRRKAAVGGSSRLRSRSRLGPRSPPPLLLQLAGCVAELVEAVASRPRPPPYISTALGAAGGEAPRPVESALAGSLKYPAEEAPARARGASAAYRPVEQLRRGSLCGPAVGTPPLQLGAGGTGAAAAGESRPSVGGVSRAVGSLVSLLAAMLGAEKDLGKKRQQQQQEQQRRRPAQEIPRASPRSQVPDRVDDGGDKRRQGEAVAKLPAAFVSEGLLRLAGVVLGAANRACLLDLGGVQVGKLGGERLTFLGNCCEWYGVASVIVKRCSSLVQAVSFVSP